MAYDRIWAQSLNNAYTPVSGTDETNWEVWALGAALLGNSNMGGFTQGLWTLWGSSNGVTSNSSDNCHLTGSGVFTTGDWLHAAAGSAHSWYVLQRVINGSTWYLTVALDSTTVTQATFIFSKSAPTGGTSTANPTQVAPNWFIQQNYNINAGSTNSHRACILLSSTGDFHFLVIQAGIASVDLWMSVLGVVGADANDAFPVWTIVNYQAGVNSTSVGALDNVNPVVNGLTAIAATFDTGAKNYILAIQQVLDSNTYDMNTGYQIDWPCWVVCAINSSAGWHHRGRLPDMVTTTATGASTCQTNGNVIGSVVGVQLGCFILPFTAAPLLT